MLCSSIDPSIMYVKIPCSQTRKFLNHNLFNDKLTKEYVKKFELTYDCSPKAFKKMVNYFKLVKQYREQETELYKLNDTIKEKYDNYSNTMKDLKSAKVDLIIV